MLDVISAGITSLTRIPTKVFEPNTDVAWLKSVQLGNSVVRQESVISHQRTLGTNYGSVLRLNEMFYASCSI